MAGSRVRRRMEGAAFSQDRTDNNSYLSRILTVSPSNPSAIREESREDVTVHTTHDSNDLRAEINV
jgi:hypothetical protein